MSRLEACRQAARACIYARALSCALNHHSLYPDCLRQDYVFSSGVEFHVFSHDKSGLAVDLLFQSCCADWRWRLYAS
jgi:hypothetical protein